MLSLLHQGISAGFHGGKAQLESETEICKMLLLSIPYPPSKPSLHCSSVQPEALIPLHTVRMEQSWCREIPAQFFPVRLAPAQVAQREENSILPCSR